MVKIPNRSLTPDERGQLKREYIAELVTAEPDIDQWTMSQKVAAFEREMIRSDPAIHKLLETGEQRKRERIEAQQAYVAKADAERQARADAEIEMEKGHRLRSWKVAGGTETEFEQQWPAMRLEIVQRRADALDIRTG